MRDFPIIPEVSLLSLIQPLPPGEAAHDDREKLVFSAFNDSSERKEIPQLPSEVHSLHSDALKMFFYSVLPGDGLPGVLCNWTPFLEQPWI